MHLVRVKTCSAVLRLPQLSAMFRDHLIVITSKNLLCLFFTGGVMVIEDVAV